MNALRIRATMTERGEHRLELRGLDAPAVERNNSRYATHCIAPRPRPSKPSGDLVSIPDWREAPRGWRVGACARFAIGYVLDHDSSGSSELAMATKVCIVSDNAYPVLDASGPGSFGGAETRAVTFARGLKQAGCQVLVAVDSEADFRRKTIEGMDIVNRRSPLSRMRASFYERVGKLERFPWIHVRRWHPVLLVHFPLMVLAFLTKLAGPVSPIRALRSLNAEIYITFGVHRTSARVVRTARQLGAQSIVFVASNADLDAKLSKGSHYVTSYGESSGVCHYTVANADSVALQTEEQARLLDERFQRQGAVIENPFDMDWWAQRLAETPSVALPAPGYVLWVGRADRFHKRPQLALQIADACPQLHFVLIVEQRDPTVEQVLAQRAPPNVELRGKTAFSDMPHYFRNAMLFLHTGSLKHEGFPNVLLQAAASELPIVALEVGEEFLARVGCGVCANGTVVDAAAAITAFAGDATRRREYGVKGRQYVLRHHRVDDKTRQVMSLFAKRGQVRSPA
jgi:glycosyltransferase involved in cell wall biosynthesis